MSVVNLAAYNPAAPYALEAQELAQTLRVPRTGNLRGMKEQPRHRSSVRLTRSTRVDPRIEDDVGDDSHNTIPSVIDYYA